MCFSLQHSLAFTLLGAAGSAAAARWQGTWSSKFVRLIAYFTLMEALQVAQYLVIDDCASKVNQALTLLGYVHIAFQPLVVNEYVFGPPHPAVGATLTRARGGALTYPAAHMFVRRLCLAGAALTLAKAAPSALLLLGADRSPALRALLGPRAARLLLTNTCGGTEMLCGERLCTLSGRHHLGWSLPMMGAGYYIASSLALHMPLMFLPACVVGGRFLRLLALFVMLTGPVMTDVLLWSATEEEERRLEWPSTWCLVSVAQVLAALAIEITANGVAAGRWRLPAEPKAQEGDKAYPTAAVSLAPPRAVGKAPAAKEL